MDQLLFENLLTTICERLTNEVRLSDKCHKPSAFERRVREVFEDELSSKEETLAQNVNQGFPDIVFGKFGAEVKATESDSWRCIANSVSEGQRALHVEHIYVIFGKMGGLPQVKWASYGDSIIHVRTSHVPRFEIELGSDRSLFKQIGVTYDEFRILPMEEKMPHIREYARGRLKTGERLWWLEDKDVDDQTHSLSLEVKVYMDLPQEQKKQLRAEAALMCPQIVGGSRQRRKYIDAVMYLMTYRGVLCPQARDLFSAGSVAGPKRGGNYLLRGLISIQQEIREAANYLEDALFQEYWGEVPPKQERISEWLRRADKFATNWKPSDELFLEEQTKNT